MTKLITDIFCKNMANAFDNLIYLYYEILFFSNGCIYM